MRIKLDENLPVELADELSNIGHDVDTVLSEGLAGHEDTAIWNATQSERRFLITQDLDFSDIRLYEPGTHCGLMLLRLRQPSRSEIMARICSVFKHSDSNAWNECFVVVTERKVRVRSPR